MADKVSDHLGSAYDVATSTEPESRYLALTIYHCTEAIIAAIESQNSPPRNAPQR